MLWATHSYLSQSARKTRRNLPIFLPTIYLFVSPSCSSLPAFMMTVAVDRPLRVSEVCHDPLTEYGSIRRVRVCVCVCVFFSCRYCAEASDAEDRGNRHTRNDQQTERQHRLYEWMDDVCHICIPAMAYR